MGGPDQPPKKLSWVLPVDGDTVVEWMAMQLAMTRNKEEEESLKNILRRMGGGVRMAVTEAGGTDNHVHSKLQHNIVGAALNNAVVSKRSDEIHALVHATAEAERGVFMDTPRGASFALKVGIVVRGGWLAVAIFGQSAMHMTTNHWRAGLGVMHFFGARE